MVSGGNFDSNEGLNPKCVGIRACNGGNNGFNYFISHCKLIGLGTAYTASLSERLTTSTASAKAQGTPQGFTTSLSQTAAPST